jgi:predicted permease
MRLLLFAFVVSLTSGLLAGCAPALQARRKSLDSSLRERGGAPSGGLALRRAIVAAEIAFSLILIIAAGLFVQTLYALSTRGPGFDTSSLISFDIRPAANGYAPADANRLLRRIHAQIRSSASTQSSAAAVFPLLAGGAWNNPLTIQSTERFTTDRDVCLNAVTPGFFATLGTRIINGRNFDEHDSLPVNEGGRRVAIVNAAFVKRYFGGRNALGAHIGMGTGPNVKPDTEIVGVVEDFSYRSVRERWEQAYFPADAGSTFYVRFRGTPESAAVAMRAIIRDADPALPLTPFRTLDEQVNRSLNTERMLASLSSSFGTLAVLLSMISLYGVISFVVTQRTREIGIRLARGDTPLRHLAGTARCASDDRSRNIDGAAMRLGVGPSCRIAAIRRQADRSVDNTRGNPGPLLDCSSSSAHSRAPRVGC